MTRRRGEDAPPADPAAELAVLEVERDRLQREHLFRGDAVENLEQMVASARRQLDEAWPAMSFVDSPQARLLANPGLALQFVIASEWWRQQQLERIAGDPRPGHAGVQWSVLTRAETAERIAEIDERLQVLDRELRIAAAEQQAADALARAEALKRGEPVPGEPEVKPEPEAEAVPVGAGRRPTETTIGDEDEDEDDLGAKIPPGA